jgi:DNA polymerase-3 subunit alpha
VRNVGEGIVELIVAERDAAGPFADFYDFCARVPTAVLNKRAIESLIHAGAFESLGHPRKGLLQVFEPIIDAYVARRREHDMGVLSLFGQSSEGPTFDDNITIPDAEFDKFERLQNEREMLGLYVSDHPMAGLEGLIARKADCPLGEALARENGTKVTVGGVITALNKKWTRRGDLMAVFTLEDLAQSVEVMVFPKTMTLIGHLLEEQKVVMVTGRVDTRDDTPKLVAVDIEAVDLEVDDEPPLRLKLPAARMDNGTLSEMKDLLLEFPGPSEVHILLDSGQVLRLNDDTRVDLRSGLIGELRVLLGPSAVVA